MKLLFLVLLVVGASECALRDKAKRIYVGTCITTGDLADTQDYTMAGQQFNMVTPGNEMKWDATEGTQGRKVYTSGDRIVAFANRFNMKVRGHTLVWHAQLPRWVNSLSGAALKSAMESRIRDIVGHYKGKLYAWDVVNEIFEWNGTLRNSIWFKNFGESFVADAFRIAHEADPSVKLYINDFGIEGIRSKSTAVYNLVKKLKSQGVPVHGVGLQTHLVVTDNETIKTFQANLQRFVDLGVEVAITEMDIAIKLPSSQADLEHQGKMYGQIVKACVDVKGCAGVTFWGYTDKYSWIPGASHGMGDALIWDKNYKPKPALAAIEAVLQ